MNTKVIRKEVEKYSNTLERVSKLYDSSITDKLWTRKVRGNFQYLINGKYSSKTKDIDKIRKIARNNYYCSLTKTISEYVSCLSEFLAAVEANPIEQAYYNLPEGIRLLIDPIEELSVEKEARFISEKYELLDNDDWVKTEYYTNKGERVRSKSEKIIADELFRRGVNYHYEKPLVLVVNGKNITVHPDFTVYVKSSGEIKYLEHLGLLGDEKYYINTIRKLDSYEKNGLLIGRDVILMHESNYSPLNTRILNEYIDEFFI